MSKYDGGRCLRFPAKMDEVYFNGGRDGCDVSPSVAHQAAIHALERHCGWRQGTTARRVEEEKKRRERKGHIRFQLIFSGHVITRGSRLPKIFPVSITTRNPHNHNMNGITEGSSVACEGKVHFVCFSLAGEVK